MPEKFVAVDASSYFYRAYHAMPRLATSSGLPTNAVKGFANMLRKVLDKFRAPFFVLVFDAAERTFRNDIYPEYKAHRPPMPDDLARQIPWVKELPQAYRIPSLELPGYEADDILATLAGRAAREGLEALVVTPDKDLMQIVTKASNDPGPGVVLYDEAKERRIGTDEVRERFGVGPERVVDILALVGDPTDNIPGVTGIGEKTAADLVARFGSVEEILEHPERVGREKLRAALVAGRESALLGKKLARLESNLPLEWTPEKFRPGTPDIDHLKRLFATLEFGSLLAALTGAPAPRRRSLETGQHFLLQSEPKLAELLGEVKQVLALEMLVAGRDPRRGEVLGIALATAPGRAAYIPIGHASLGDRPLDRGAVLERLRPVLENPAVTIACHNAKSLLQALWSWGADLRGPLADVMLASYVLDPDKASGSLEKLAAEHLGHDLEKKSSEELSPERAFHRMCEGADALLALVPLLEGRVREAGGETIYREIELPLARVLAEIESAGVRVDVEFLKKLSAEFEARIRAIEKKAHSLAGVEFNLNSHQQLAQVLFEKLGLPRGKKTETGWSTDHDVLQALSARHPLPAALLEHRALAKLKGTFIDALGALVDPKTGRVHTSYNQAVAATGRLSSSDPNLQNIPVRTEEGKLIREAFTAGPGRTLVVGDYSQIELRLLAHLSEDPILTRAFAEERDVHAETAAEVFGVDPKLVTPDLRRKAKEVNFGILYGMSAHGLASRLAIPQAEAKSIIDRYFSRYQGVRRYLDGILAGARREGFVQTLFGRRRYFGTIESKSPVERAQAERAAINAPIQGTAADVIKIAMIRLPERLRTLDSRMILQVHDELILDAPEGRADEAGKVLAQVMEQVHAFRVPLKVDVGIGRTWGQAKP